MGISPIAAAMAPTAFWNFSWTSQLDASVKDGQNRKSSNKKNLILFAWVNDFCLKWTFIDLQFIFLLQVSDLQCSSALTSRPSNKNWGKNCMISRLVNHRKCLHVTVRGLSPGLGPLSFQAPMWANSSPSYCEGCHRWSNLPDKGFLYLMICPTRRCCRCH